jgi:diacylglycerol kinase (ATP)
MTKFGIGARLNSIGYALEGVATLIRTQHNTWIHLAATIAVISAGLYFGISNNEWLALIFAIALVWCAEALNTAFEFLCDVASPDFHPKVKQAKDVAAAAVLFASLAAVAVGLIVFGPRLLALLA